MSKPVIQIRKHNNLAELVVTQGAITPELTREIEGQLSYNHVSQLRGQQAYSSGSYRPFQTDLIALFKYDKNGNLIFPKGFTTRVHGICKEAGCDVTVVERPPAHIRPDRYAVDFEKVFAHMELRAKQDECLASISVNDGGQIVAPTGFGKSHLFGAVCLMYPNAKIHVVTRRKDVMKRLVRHLVKFIPNIGQIGGGNKTWGRVTVITADSLHLVDHSPANAADIVLYDEVHEAAAPSYSNELAKYQNAKMFGFTATPEGRFDGAHHKLEGLFGPKIFEMSYQEAVGHGLVLPVRVEWIDVKIEKNPCEFKREVSKERWGIWRNNVRNKMIAEKAREFSEDDQVLILVRTLEHAVFLKQHLPEFKMCYDKMDGDMHTSLIKKGMLDMEDEPPMTPAARDQMSRDFEAGTLKKVIATDVWSTGVDFPQLSVLIRADARASEIMDIQAPGRVVRRHDASGKAHGLVIDCMDYFDGAFLRRSMERKKTYMKQGWEMPNKKRVRGPI